VWSVWLGSLAQQHLVSRAEPLRCPAPVGPGSHASEGPGSHANHTAPLGPEHLHRDANAVAGALQAFWAWDAATWDEADGGYIDRATDNSGNVTALGIAGLPINRIKTLNTNLYSLYVISTLHAACECFRPGNSIPSCAATRSTLLARLNKTALLLSRMVQRPNCIPVDSTVQAWLPLSVAGNGSFATANPGISVGLSFSTAYFVDVALTQLKGAGFLTMAQAWAIWQPIAAAVGYTGEHDAVGS
jgi:hypothetical protein